MSEDSRRTENEEILLLKKQIADKDEQIQKLVEEQKELDNKICELNRQGRATLGIKNHLDWQTYTLRELFEITEEETSLISHFNHYGYSYKIIITPRGHIFRVDTGDYELDVDRMLYWDGFKLWYTTDYENVNKAVDWYEDQDVQLIEIISKYAENLAAEKAIEQAFFSEPEQI